MIGIQWPVTENVHFKSVSHRLSMDSLQEWSVHCSGVVPTELSITPSFIQLYHALSYCGWIYFFTLYSVSLICVFWCILISEGHILLLYSFPPSSFLIFFWHLFLKFIFNWSLIALQCCSFPLYNSMNQLYVYVYPVLLSFPPTWHLYFLKFALELFKICFSIIFPC